MYGYLNVIMIYKNIHILIYQIVRSLPINNFSIEKLISEARFPSLMRLYVIHKLIQIEY